MNFDNNNNDNNKRIFRFPEVYFMNIYFNFTRKTGCFAIQLLKYDDLFTVRNLTNLILGGTVQFTI